MIKGMNSREVSTLMLQTNLEIKKALKPLRELVEFIANNDTLPIEVVREAFIKTKKDCYETLIKEENNDK